MKRPADNLDHCAAIAVVVLASSACETVDDSGAGRAGGRVQIAISGEDIASEGIAFPEGSEVTIVDGWQLELSHVLVTVGNVTLSDNPDLAPSDQSRTGAVAARAEGPWAVDLHVPGTIPGAGGEGLATPLAWLENESERGGAALASDPHLDGRAEKLQISCLPAPARPSSTSRATTRRKLRMGR